MDARDFILKSSKLFTERPYQGQKGNCLEKILVLIILFIIAFVYLSDTLNCWFFYDDPAAMVSSTGSLKEIFIENHYSYAFYTPLVALSFKPDVILFGLNPLPYHIHNVILLALIAFMGYQILRLYTDRLSASLAAIIILFATPSLVCVIWITLRQYLYAMLFSLTALYLYLKYTPTFKHNTFTVLLITILCELSFMGKEQFITLPFVLFILSEGSFKKKIQKTFPYFLVLVAHFLFRWHMLESFGGPVGAYYDIKVYIRTIFLSIFTASKVLFGYTWFIVFILFPLLLKGEKIILSVLLWLSSLSISFLAMSYYPYADTYRYWLIPTILVSLVTGLNANRIKNILMKGIYCFVIIAFFLYHTLNVNKDVKATLREESLIAQHVSKSLLDNRFINSMILLPNNHYITASGYIYYMSKVYRKIGNFKIFPTFYPLELLVFFPEITKDFKYFYEIKGNNIFNITDSIEEKINRFKEIISNEKPAIKLFKEKNRVELSLKCMANRSLITYLVRKMDEKYYTVRNTLPYIEKIDVTSFFKGKNIGLLPIEILSYHDSEWFISNNPILEHESFVTGSCIDSEGRHTLLSDALFVTPNPKR